MTIGLKTVRELCLRAPLIMSPELLQDLALYKKFRDKEARCFITFFLLNVAITATCCQSLAGTWHCTRSLGTRRCVFISCNHGQCIDHS